MMLRSSALESVSGFAGLRTRRACNLRLLRSFTLFRNMTQSLRQNRSDMLVVEGIKHAFSVPAGFHKPVRLKQPQLMRYRRLRHSQKLRDITDAHLARLKRVHYPNPRGITENLENLGQIKQLFIVGHQQRRVFKQFPVHMALLTCYRMLQSAHSFYI